VIIAGFVHSWVSDSEGYEETIGEFDSDTKHFERQSSILLMHEAMEEIQSGDVHCLPRGLSTAVIVAHGRCMISGTKYKKKKKPAVHTPPKVPRPGCAVGKISQHFASDPRIRTL